MSEEELIDKLYSVYCNNNDDIDLRYTDIIYNSIIEKDKEIERLNNIIDELEKYLNNEINEWEYVDDTITRSRVEEDKEILDKLKELKEGK